jgi:hypothetical protein
MWNAFREGGFVMFPTLVIGLALLALAVRYAARPERRLLPLLGAFALLTGTSGALGFVLGAMKSLYAQNEVQSDKRWISLIGIAESLNNVAFALLLIFVAAVLMTVGEWKIASTARAAST